MNTLQSIGIFGGSFDPVHNGHVLVARAALEELSLDRLFIVPAARSPFKPEQQPAAADVRLRLLRLAFAGENRCELDTQELDRDGVSYSIDTLDEYTNRYPEAKLHYLIGADHVPTFHSGARPSAWPSWPGLSLCPGRDRKSPSSPNRLAAKRCKVGHSRFPPPTSANASRLAKRSTASSHPSSQSH